MIAHPDSLALLEMKMLLKAIYSEYRTVVAADMKSCMDPDDQVISSRPKDQKCFLEFQKI